MDKVTHTRVSKHEDGTYNVESSMDNGKTWNQETHRKFWFGKLAKAHARVNFPHAKHVGEVKG